MKILSVDRKVKFDGLDITSVAFKDLQALSDIEQYNYIIVHGGDGAIRRVVQFFYYNQHNPNFIIDTAGSFNVISKINKLPKMEEVLHKLSNNKDVKKISQPIYKLNDEIFLFSAGNMGDLRHILLSETLRFGIIKNGMLKYLISLIYLLPLFIIMTPFELFSKHSFFIFTPLKIIKKFGNFYGEVVPFRKKLESNHNLIELDGDIVVFYHSSIKVDLAGSVTLIS
ncbi:MAG: hypothetical protein JXQ77_02855 [Campylobacterales bacterium]|nr:hypothetical protein [Campylobacterales bacterium]